MVKKPFKGNYLTFEVRASYDSKTDTIHLTTKDKDIITKNGFNVALNSGRDAEDALRTVMVEKGLIPKENEIKYIPVKAFYGDSPNHHIRNVFPLGIYGNGEEATWDCLSSPNMFIVGKTGGGKSVLQRNLIFHCLQNSEQWMFLGIDLKQVELTPYKKYGPAVMDIATDITQSVHLLRYAKEEMMLRYKELEEKGLNNILDLETPYKSIMIMVDELFALLAPLKNQTEAALKENELKAEISDLLLDLLRLGRAAGIQLVVATQLLDTDVISGMLLHHFSTRVAAGPLDLVTSVELLGNDRATELDSRIKGRTYMKHYSKGAEFQAYYAPMDYLDNLNQ